MPAAGVFLVARRVLVLGLVLTRSMIADSGRVYTSGNRASLREERRTQIGGWQLAAAGRAIPPPTAQYLDGPGGVAIVGPIGVGFGGGGCKGR